MKTTDDLRSFRLAMSHSFEKQRLKRQKVRKDKCLSIRCTKDMYDKIVQEAKQYGMSISSLLLNPFISKKIGGVNGK